MASHIVKSVVSKKLLMGFCLPCLHSSAAKVRVATLEFDAFVNMYFKHYDDYYAHDPEKKCKSGDMVIIKELDKSLSKLVTHEVFEIAYPFGDILDPVTGKKCAGTQYRDAKNKEAEMFGVMKGGYDYLKAPKRGWQEGKRDFTDRLTYIKYNEFPKDDENHEQPYSYFN